MFLIRNNSYILVLVIGLMAGDALARGGVDMNVIINADDLGYSERVNREIFSLMRKGKITSATAMPTALFFDSAVKESKLYTSCSFGCHLNLTELHPVTSQQILYDFGVVDDDGFTGRLRDVKINRHLLSAIYYELEQQVIKMLDYGIGISHFDSHHHIHTMPVLFFVINKLMCRFNINKIRITMNYYGTNYDPSARIKMQKWIWNKSVKYWVKAVTVDYFTRAKWFINAVNSSKHPVNSDSTIELMCHPGGGAEYDEETSMLYEEWYDHSPYRINFISYNELL